MRVIIFLICSILLSNTISAQNEEIIFNKRPIEIGFEFQVYPAGIMPGLKMEMGLGSYYKNALNLRVGYNRARRHDWGEHEDERGGGWGGSIGYRYYIIKPMKSLFAGIKTDIWKLNIDWRNSGTDEILWTNDDAIGISKILIFQPTAEIGYKFFIPVGESGNNGLYITPTFAFGLEINVKTEGDPVGQGTIGLLGLEIGYRF